MSPLEIRMISCFWIIQQWKISKVNRLIAALYLSKPRYDVPDKILTSLIIGIQYLHCQKGSGMHRDSFIDKLKTNSIIDPRAQYNENGVEAQILLKNSILVFRKLENANIFKTFRLESDQVNKTNIHTMDF